MSSGRMNLCSKIVGSLIAWSNPSDRDDHSDLASKSDRALIDGSRTNALVRPSILKLLAVTGTTKIGKALSNGQASISSSK